MPPTTYGRDQLVLMVRDPWWLFAYWEVLPETERAARRQLAPEEVAGLRSVLRVYDVTDRRSAEEATGFMDLTLSGLATNWYIHTDAPDREFIADMGLLTQQGRFLRLVRSNRVRTPRASPSDIIDGEWETSPELEQEWAKLLGAPSSAGARWTGAWSGSVAGSRAARQAAGTGTAPGVRGLWVRVDTDVVLYGVTDPKATVRIQGQPATVRPDGTFRLRVGLPEGTQSITIEATSADGRQTTSVASVIMRAGRFAPIGQPPGEASPRVGSLELPSATDPGRRRERTPP